MCVILYSAEKNVSKAAVRTEAGTKQTRVVSATIPTLSPVYLSIGRDTKNL